MTLRQVVGLSAVINRSETIDFYNNTLSYGLIHGAKLPSLDEFLNLNSNKDETSFSEKDDKFLEQEALKRLEERRKKWQTTNS